MCKKNCANCNKLHIFEKQKHLQNFENLIVCSRKTENVQIPFKEVCAKICAKFLAKIVQSACFCYRLLKSYKLLKSNVWK